MDVSVVILNYNTFDLTCQCVESVYEHTKSIRFEIIIVDNASTECPPSLFKQRFPDIQLIESESNLGFAKGNNLALPYAKGQTILLLNSDTVLCNDAIGIAYQKMKTDPTIGALSAKLLYTNGKIQPCANRFPSIQTELIELFRLQKIFPSKKAVWLLGFFFDHKKEIEADWIWATFFMTRQEIIHQFTGGKLCDDFFMYGEDMQWCYEIKQMGYRIVYYPEAEVIHYISVSTNKDKSIDKKMLMLQHEYYFLRKYYGEKRAKVIFWLKSLKYRSLSSRNINFRQLADLYSHKKNWQ